MTGFWIRIGLTLLGVTLLSLLVQAIGGGFSGLITGLLCMSAWVVFQVWHLQKMALWLQDFRLNKTPSGLGTWDILFSSIYRLARSYERQQYQLQELLTSFRGATEAMPDGVVSLDNHNQITYASQKAQQHIGLKGDMDLGRNIVNLLRHPQFARYLEKENWTEPLLLRDVPQIGQILQVQVVPYGKSERLLLSRDVTQIEKLETTRRDFVANVSHELKTPLTVLAGFIETLRDLPLDNEQRASALSTMAGQAERMQRLIDDLLALARLESDQKPVPSRLFKALPLIERTLGDARQLSRDQHQIRYQEQPAPLEISGDEQELASAFGNLVSNAVRYTPDQGSISIGWQWIENGRAAFWVRDTGPGIAPEHLSRLTERFYRIDKGRSRANGGTGLGLAIVKHIASRHQLELSIQSRLGEGSQFSLIFPASRIR
jgi:two-component system phosphate regulon sensor histidine kinase PhoR